MEKTLLTKKSAIKIPRNCFSIILLMFISGFSFSTATASALADNRPDATTKLAKEALTIKGNVTDDSNGQRLPGVSVVIKGTETGTVTDANGDFSLQVPENAILIFSFIGYDPVEVIVDKKTSYLNVKLSPSSAKKLNEVVVIGYGTQKKTSTTAAVSTVNTADIAEKPVVDLTNSLVGRASGLIVVQSSGEPGFDGSSIQIRGTGSIGNTQPLYIVDGVPRDFSLLDPNSVASITILKDAAAVAPYGVAGANGVILVTTKQGKSGKPLLTFNSYYAIQNPTRVPGFVNSYQYALLRNEANQNDNPGSDPLYSANDLKLFQDHSDPDGHPDGHPLQEIIMKNRPLNYDNISLSGGTDAVKYFAAIGYTHQDGMWTTSYLNKYNGLLNLTAKATNTTTVGLSVNRFVEDQNFPPVSAQSIIDRAMRQAPTTPVYYSNGLWSSYIGQSLIGVIYHSGYQTNQNTNLYSQLYINQELPIKGLSIKGVINYDNSPQFTRIYNTPIPSYNVDTSTKPYTYNEGFQGSAKPNLYESYSQNNAITYQGLLNYAGSFGKSNITGLAVVEYRNVNYQTFSATRLNYNLNIDELSFGGPLASDATNSGYSSGQKQIGYVYRLGYAYDNKYLFEADGRYDGSYLFGPGNRFGFFPAFSAGWRLSEEKFIKDNFTWIDNLKIRASWGQSGAYPSAGGSIQTYQYLSPYNVTSNSAVIDGSSTQGIAEALQGNPSITWEKSNKTDVGFEASLWKGVLGIEADYFYEKRSNMLVSVGNSLPAEYGIGTGLVNGGIMQNHGIDLTLTTTERFSNDLRLDVKGTFTFARNKLLHVFENSFTYNNPNTRQTGRPLGTQFGLDAIGYFTAADFNPDGTLKAGIPVPSFGPVKPGDIQYADLNHDGIIDQNDIKAIGHPNTPEIIYGLEPRLTYKNFDLDMLFQGAASSDIMVGGYFVNPFGASGSVSDLVYANHWTPTNLNALYPRVSGTPTVNNSQASSWWIRNTSYIRMKSFELGYTFSNKLMGHAVRTLRLYVAGQNVFTWTPYMKEIMDPEEAGNNENYFQQRVFSIGVNATF